jgi:hypothetical protein
MSVRIFIKNRMIPDMFTKSHKTPHTRRTPEERSKNEELELPVGDNWQLHTPR